MKQRFLLALGLTALTATTPIAATSDDFDEFPSDHATTREVYSDAGNIPIKIAVNDVGQEADDDQGIEGSDDIEGSETVSLAAPDLSIDQKKKSLLI